MKILIGSLPGAYWGMVSAATGELPDVGHGQRLLDTFLRAKKAYHPEYFILETSAHLPRGVYEYIKKKLRVDGILFDSRLVSPQNKARLFWVGHRAYNRNYYTCPITLPNDKGLVVSNILQSGISSGMHVYKIRPNSIHWKTYDINRQTRVASAMPINGREASIRHDSRQYRVYSPFGKGVTLCGNAGGVGAVTGLYMVPVRNCNFHTYNVTNGHLSLDGIPRKIALPDGKYIIRRLTVRECKRMQTIPDDYRIYATDTRILKLIGNTPTVDVLAYILNQLPYVSLETLEVLSIYDGISAAQIALDKIGADVLSYTALEADPYAVRVTKYNFPDTKYIEKGDL